MGSCRQRAIIFFAPRPTNRPVNWIHSQHLRGLVFKSVKIKRLDWQSTLFIIAVAAHKLLMLKITVIKYMLNKPWILREALRSKPQIKKNKPIAEMKRVVCKYEPFVLVCSAKSRLRWLLSSRAAWDSSNLTCLHGVFGFRGRKIQKRKRNCNKWVSGWKKLTKKVKWCET